ncbi:porin [uncultured Vibrio sp.]|uniref:porin n=1 Tax=uncultured Vibrio sp. TaxID=114054 RepID=UPI0025F9745F|nr:porin [uncultured Vibrio sp.]
MKKAVIASAVLSALVSGSALAANVYSADGTELNIGGRAEFRGDFGADTDGEKIEGTMQNNSRFRLNVSGTTAINDSLSGFGKYEAEQRLESSSDDSRNDALRQRYLFAGLKGEFGAFSVGRQDTAGVQISGMSDIGTHTGDQKAFIDAGNEQINNTFLYGFSTDSLNVQASYIAGEDKDTDGFGISGIYSLPMGLDLGLGYAAGDNGVGNGSSDQIIAGVSYELDALYLGATYTMGDIELSDTSSAKQEFTGVELSAQYKLTNQFRLIAAYAKQEVENKSASSKDVKSDFFELTGRYDFNKSIHTYASYKLNNLDNKDTNYDADAKDTIRLGLRYNF